MKGSSGDSLHPVPQGEEVVLTASRNDGSVWINPVRAGCLSAPYGAFGATNAGWKSQEDRYFLPAVENNLNKGGRF